MSLIFNGVNIPEAGGVIGFNGVDITTVIFNGVTVWQRGSGIDVPAVPSFCEASDGDYPDRVDVYFGYAGVDVTYFIFRDDIEIGSVVDIMYYEDFTAVDGVTYVYKVQAAYSATPSTRSAFSEENAGFVSDGSLIPPVPELAPANFSASDDTYSEYVRCTWSNGTENAATSVSIYRNGSHIDSVPFGSTEYMDLTAVPGTTYTYHVAFKSAGGTGPISNTDTGSRSTSQPYVLKAGDTMTGQLSGVRATSGNHMVTADAYATSNLGGTIKARYSGGILFLGNTGSNP